MLVYLAVKRTILGGEVRVFSLGSGAIKHSAKLQSNRSSYYSISKLQINADYGLVNMFPDNNCCDKPLTPT